MCLLSGDCGQCVVLCSALLLQKHRQTENSLRLSLTRE